jgi:hypothetical protein
MSLTNSASSLIRISKIRNKKRAPACYKERYKWARLHAGLHGVGKSLGKLTISAVDAANAMKGMHHALQMPVQ